jgi:chorismate mutase/prephenate dehydratase
MKLDDCRKEIDAIDTEILILLNRRANLSRRIGRIKTIAALPSVDRGREEIVIRRVVRENAGDIGDRALTSIYREILSESRRIQNSVAIECASTGARTK